MKVTKLAGLKFFQIKKAGFKFLVHQRGEVVLVPGQHLLLEALQQGAEELEPTSASCKSRRQTRIAKRSLSKK